MMKLLEEIQSTCIKGDQAACQTAWLSHCLLLAFQFMLLMLMANTTHNDNYIDLHCTGIVSSVFWASFALFES